MSRNSSLVTCHSQFENSRNTWEISTLTHTIADCDYQIIISHNSPEKEVSWVFMVWSSTHWVVSHDKCSKHYILICHDRIVYSNIVIGNHIQNGESKVLSVLPTHNSNRTHKFGPFWKLPSPGKIGREMVALCFSCREKFVCSPRYKTKNTHKLVIWLMSKGEVKTFHIFLWLHDETFCTNIKKSVCR